MKNNKKKDIYSVQNWIGIKSILPKGIVELENEEYIKIIKIIPINYLMKTDFEKESILEGYKTFLKTCNFDMQIVIQNKKEDLSENIELIKKEIEKEENEKINNIRKNYIEYIEKNNLETESSSKNFFLIIKKKSPEINSKEIIIEELNTKYLKIKECLNRCGNKVEELNYEKINKIIYSFFNTRKFLNMRGE